MTAQELIETLKQFDPDTEVMFSYDYGDYWHTFVCKKVQNISLDNVRYSPYHNMNVVDTNEDVDYETAVIVLS